MSSNKSSNNQHRTIYCHFSFKRPKDKGYGLFAVAFYNDFAGKQLITHKTIRDRLWEDQQFISAIQSYYIALLTIFEFQGMMKTSGISQIMLVTDNSTLAGWIENPKKNKTYTGYMDKAVKPFRAGSYKEIVLGVGLCEPRKAEKSYKYCKDELVEIDNTQAHKRDTNSNSNGYKIPVSEYKSVLDIIAEDKSIPDISGIELVSDI